ncbi:hypothetical protein CHUAL_006918 [Chamberlinius hualienensis]
MPAIMGDNSGLSQKDTTFTKIFVGGLPYHTTDKSLREHFETYGDIEEAVVITDRQTGKSRGYGFVTMTDRLAAERACKDANPIIDGRKANVNLAYIGAKPRGNAQHGIPLPVRTGYPSIIPGQYGLPPSYIYSSPFVSSPGGGLIPLSHAPISPAAAAAAAAAQFYADFSAASQFATNGYDPAAHYGHAYSSAAAAAAGYMPAPNPSAAAGYTYAPLPQAISPAAIAAAAAAATGNGNTTAGGIGAGGGASHFPLAYTPQLQETRMQ